MCRTGDKAPSLRTSVGNIRAKSRVKSGIRQQISGLVPLPPSQQKEQALFIHEKWYDVTDFTDHPGGPIALAIGAGRDATGMFEMHHVRPQAREALSQFEIPEEEVLRRGLKVDEDKGHFEWEGFHDDSFVKDARGVVIDYFSKEAVRRGVSFRQATKATPWRLFEILVFCCIWLACLPYFFAGEYWAAPVTAVTAWLFGVNYWHDAMHFTLSTNWKVNALTPYLQPFFSSPYAWYHQHVIGHHVHTNVGHRDPDLAHAPGFLREHSSVKHRPAHKHQHFMWHFLGIWSIGVTLGLNLLNDVRAHMKECYNGVVVYHKMTGTRLAIHILGRMAYFFAVAGWPWCVFPAGKALYFVLVPSMIYSGLFMVTSQVAHLLPHTAHASDPNFYKHQIVTTQDFAPTPAANAPLWKKIHSRLTFYASGGLNMQVEHHLFPGVNHCHLGDLHQLLLPVLKKHGLKHLSATGYVDAVQQHFSHTRDMSVKPLLKEAVHAIKK